MRQKVVLRAEEARLITLQLSVLLNAGVGIERSLLALRTTEMGRIRQFAEGVWLRLERGRSLAQAMSAETDSFGQVSISLVEAGEKTGRLVHCLRELSARLDKLHHARSRLIGALSYPLGILVGGSLLVVFMSTFMLPKFMEAVGSMLQTPPWPTRVLLAIADLGEYLAAAFLLALCSIPWLLSDVPAAKKLRAWCLYDSPILGKINSLSDLARVNLDFALMLDAGLTVETSMHVLRPASPVLAEAIPLSLDHLRRGESLSKALQLGGFPRSMVAIVAVGEESGSLSQLLNLQGRLLEEEVERRQQDFTKLIEPLAMLALGVAVGFVMLGCFLPVYKLVEVNL